MAQGGNMRWRTQLPGILHLRVFDSNRPPICRSAVDLAGKSALLRRCDFTAESQPVRLALRHFAPSRFARADISEFCCGWR